MIVALGIGCDGRKTVLGLREGATENTTVVVSLIVAPNSGTPPGDTTIQGQVSATPEPATLSLIGGALLGLGFLRRKNFPHR